MQRARQFRLHNGGTKSDCTTDSWHKSADERTQRETRGPHSTCPERGIQGDAHDERPEITHKSQYREGSKFRAKPLLNGEKQKGSVQGHSRENAVNQRFRTRFRHYDAHIIFDPHLSQQGVPRACPTPNTISLSIRFIIEHDVMP